MPKNRKRKIYFSLLIILVSSTILVIMARQNRPSGETIKVINPSFGSIQSLISTTGVVKPQNRLEIKPPINGRIEEIEVLEGQKVKVGQTLAWMSSTERAALLDAARAQGEETLKYWQEAYKATPLIAPIDGEVIVRAVEPGQTVTSSDVIVVLSDRLIVKAQVDETDIGSVKVGQKAIISLDAYPEIKAKGRVDHISYESEIINNVTIYEVDVLPERVPEVFRSGMSANVEIIEKSKDNILLIPREAVIKEADKNFVLLSQGANKKAVKQKIRLGVFDDENVEVVSGLSKEDAIIIKRKKHIYLKARNSGSSPFMPKFKKK